jgi:hypothetical protein
MGQEGTCWNCERRIPRTASFCPWCGEASDHFYAAPQLTDEEWEPEPQYSDWEPLSRPVASHVAQTPRFAAPPAIPVVVPASRNPVVTFFKRVIGVIAGIPMILITLYGLWNSWLIISGIFMLDVNRVIAGLVIEVVIGVVGAILFAIVRWGFELGD